MKPRSMQEWKSFASLPTSRLPLFSKTKSTSSGQAKTPVYLNIYDLTPMNGYVYSAGLGIFHSGVEVHGVEYAFGAHDYSASGVFEVEPRQSPCFKFRKSLLIGTTSLDSNQVRQFMEHHSASYYGDTYHLILKNCNHFSKYVCYKLTGKSIPRWVNRLAKIGSMCSCLFPEALKITTAGHDPQYKPFESEKTSLRPSFDLLSSISTQQRRQLSTSSLFLQMPSKGGQPPWEPKSFSSESWEVETTSEEFGQEVETTSREFRLSSIFINKKSS